MATPTYIAALLGVRYTEMAEVNGVVYLGRSPDENGNVVFRLTSYDPKLVTDLDDYGLFRLDNVSMEPVTLPDGEESVSVLSIHPDGWMLVMRAHYGDGGPSDYAYTYALYRHDGDAWAVAATLPRGQYPLPLCRLEVMGGRLYMLTPRPNQEMYAYRGGQFVRVPQAGDPELRQWPVDVQRLIAEVGEGRIEWLYNTTWGWMHYNQPPFDRWRNHWWSAQAYADETFIRSLEVWSPPIAHLPAVAGWSGLAVGAVFALGPYLCVVCSCGFGADYPPAPALIALVGGGVVRRRVLGTFPISARTCGDTTYLVGQAVARFWWNVVARVEAVHSRVGTPSVPVPETFAQNLYIIAPKRVSANRLILRWFKQIVSPLANAFSLRWSTGSGETSPQVESLAVRWSGDGATSPEVGRFTLRWVRNFRAALNRFRLRWTTGPRHNPALNRFRLLWSKLTGEHSPDVERLTLRWLTGGGTGEHSPEASRFSLRWAFHNTWNPLAGQAEVKRFRLRWSSAYVPGEADEILWLTFDDPDMCYTLRGVTQLGEDSETDVLCLVRADAEDQPVDSWATYQHFHPNEWVTLKNPGRLLRIGVVKPAGDPKFDLLFEIPRESRD